MLGATVTIAVICATYLAICSIEDTYAIFCEKSEAKRQARRERYRRAAYKKAIIERNRKKLWEYLQ